MIKKAFTLIELVVAIMILSILMLFLYKSYAELGKVNNSYTKTVEKLYERSLIHRTLYLDFLKGFKQTLVINHNEKSFDFISLMSANSIHRRINPYVTYLVKEGTLYRLESKQQIKSTDVERDIAFDVDKIGEIEKFKLFSSKKKEESLYLLYVKFKDKPKVFFKIKVLN